MQHIILFLTWHDKPIYGDNDDDFLIYILPFAMLDINK